MIDGVKARVNHTERKKKAQCWVGEATEVRKCSSWTINRDEGAFMLSSHLEQHRGRGRRTAEGVTDAP